MEPTRKAYLLKALVGELCAERDIEAPRVDDVRELWTAFRALVNMRPPIPPSAGFLAQQDELLGGLIAETGIHVIEEAEPSPSDGRLRLWRGDIITLAADAIVNAANSQMLGCWAPGHHCIDNAIHTFAGVQLRLECARIMDEQGHDEPTGQAKITRAYNLPARHVIHTVGPIANGRLTPEHEAQLASSYRSCLDTAAEHDLRSIAFCCISTGVFGFPQQQASRIAVQTVHDWLDAAGHSLVVVFNVFSDEDERLYRKLLHL